MSSVGKLRIRRDDLVVVVSGKEKGTVGRVLKVDVEARRVVVEGVRLTKKHRKGTGDTPGSVVESESSIHISNVALWDSGRSIKVKIGFAVIDGKKTRVDRKTGTPYGQV